MPASLGCFPPEGAALCRTSSAISFRHSSICSARSTADNSARCRFSAISHRRFTLGRRLPRGKHQPPAGRSASDARPGVATLLQHDLARSAAAGFASQFHHRVGKGPILRQPRHQEYRGTMAARHTQPTTGERAHMAGQGCFTVAGRRAVLHGENVERTRGRGESLSTDRNAGRRIGPSMPHRIRVKVRRNCPGHVSEITARRFAARFCPG